MKTKKKDSGIKVSASVKAGGFGPNHSRSGLRVKSAIKAGGTFQQNHTSQMLAV